MAEFFRLEILTPYGRYYDNPVEFLEVHSEDYNLGILANHAPLVSTVAISKLMIRKNGKESVYACGGGVINVTKEKVTLVLDSIERSDEIDVQRAKEAKERALERLEEGKKNETIDMARAKVALMKALNRINIGTNY